MASASTKSEGHDRSRNVLGHEIWKKKETCLEA